MSGPADAGSHHAGSYDAGSYDTAAFDVDGTLVDTNYQHTLAWFRAFRQRDVTVPIWRIHRAIGMGGDQLVAAVAGDDVERRLGDELRDAWTVEFDKMLAEVVPFAGARDLLVAARERGFKVVLASSGQAKHTEHYLDLLDAHALIDGLTTSDDVKETKPAPDLIDAALTKVSGRRGILVGDSTWDSQAAVKAGALSYAVKTGGFSTEELEQAGGAQVYDDLPALLADIDRTALAAAEGKGQA